MKDEWIATSATVTSCKYQFARMNTLTLGIPTQDRFRIAFDYYAHGRLYSDEMQSPRAIAQNERIALSYNPLAPEENSLGRGRRKGSDGTGPLLLFGIAGSVILSLAWLLVLRGCS